MLLGHTPLHTLNLAVHVAFGSAALLLGLVAILSIKGRRLHARSGMFFLFTYLAVVATALIGVIFFGFRSFLTVVTILSFYDAFAGYRALQLRGERPRWVDRLAATLGMATPWIFIAVMHHLHQPWAPVLTWSILGGLILVSGYDLLRNVLPLSYLRHTWLQEHLLKMLGCYIAITSAFAATVFPRSLPTVAILPSVIGVVIGVGFVAAGPGRWDRRAGRQRRIDATN